MTQYETTNKGRLFKNPKKAENPAAPDYKGELDVDGQVFDLAGWVNTIQKGENQGQKYMSLKLSKKTGWKRQSENQEQGEWIA